MALRGEAPDRPTYVNHRPIGPGNSELYDADHSVFGVPVVQKIVPDRAVDPDALLVHEPQLLKSLEHRCIPRIFEAQYDPNRPGAITMVIEKVGDMDAGAVVLGQKAPLSVGETTDVALDLLSALSYLHVVHGVVHRDVKPDNVRLSAARRDAWLIDFNTSGRCDGNGLVPGAATPAAWMAPEVPASGYSVRSEIYALGVVLYELLRGRQMLDDYPLEKVEQRVTVRGLRGFPNSHYRRWPTHVPEGLRRVINKAVAADPADRWSTADDMRTAVGRLTYTDWERDHDAEERWSGAWPSTAHEGARVDVEVVVRTLAGGPDRGRRRASARYRPGTGWRRLEGLTDRLVDTEADLSQFFDDVDKRLARLRPAS